MDSTDWLNGKERLCWILIFLIAGVVYFSSVNRPLRDAESKYAEIPREILVTGDWITPHLDFVNYYTKPPLTFWVTALAYRVFGVHPWVARVTNILWAFLASLLLGLLASEMHGKWTGPLASAGFLLTAEVFTYCLDAGIEFGLISCIIFSLVSFWIYCQKDQKRYLRFFYLGLGLCYLAKGILGIALPATIAVLFFVFSGRIRRAWQLFDPVGLLLLVIGVIPWSMAMSLKHPDFLRYFVVNEHFGAFLGRRDSNDALFSTKLFLGLITGEFFPWVLYLPLIFKSAWSNWKRGGQEREKVLFLLIWAAVPLVLFSTSKSKVDFYGMHVYPPLLVLLASEAKGLLENRTQKASKLWTYPWVAVGVIAFLSLGFLQVAGKSSIVADLNIPSLAVAKVFLLSSGVLGFVVFIFFRKSEYKKAFLTISLLMIVFFFCTEQMFISCFEHDSMKFATDIYNQVATKNDPLFTDELPEFAHVGTLVFYTGKPAFLLRNRVGSKLYFVLKDRMSRCFDEVRFVKFVKKQGGNVYLVGKKKKTIERLGRLGLSYKILGNGGEKALFLVNPSKCEQTDFSDSRKILRQLSRPDTLPVQSD